MNKWKTKITATGNLDKKITLLSDRQYSYCNADGCRCFSDFFYSIDERAVCRTSADAE